MPEFVVFLIILFGGLAGMLLLGLGLNWLGKTRAGRKLANAKTTHDLLAMIKVAGVAALTGLVLAPVTEFVLLLVGAPGGNSLHLWAWGITTVLLLPMVSKVV